MKNIRTRNWTILLAVGVFCLAIALVLLAGSTFPGVTYRRVKLTTSGLESRPVTISGLLITPKDATRGKMPGVVFAHGITASKEWYIQMTRAIARSGIAVLSIDLRGHGGSGGYCTWGRDEIKDIWAAADYLRRDVPGVDDYVVAMGHSLGGISSARAGALDTRGRIQSVVAIYCWTNWQSAMDDILGTAKAIINRGWELTTFSRHLGPGALASKEFNILAAVSDTRPPNYLLAIGNQDEAGSVESERRIIEKMTRRVRGQGTDTWVRAGFTYGNLADGTARRLVVSGDDHVTEMTSGVITREAIDWIRRGAGLAPSVGGMPFLWWRPIGITMLAAAILFLAMGAMSLVRPRLFVGAGEVGVSELIETRSGARSLELALYALPLLAASYLAVPVAKAVGFGPFIPYGVVNEFSTFFVSRSFVLLPVYVLVIALAARRSPAGSGRWPDLEDSAGTLVKSALYGLVPVAIAVALLAVLVLPLVLPRAIPKLPAYFFLGVACLGTGVWLEDYLFYRLAYPALGPVGEQPAPLRAAAAHAVALDLVVLFALLPIVGGPGATVLMLGLRVPVVVPILFSFPAFLLVAWVSLRMRAFTGSSIAFSLMVTALATWFLTAPISVRGF